MSFKFLNVTVAATLVLLTFTSGHKDEQRHQRFIAGNSNQLCYKCDDASVNPEEGCAHTTVYPRLSPMTCHDYCIAHISVTNTGRVLAKRGCGTQNQCIQGFADTLTKRACFSTNKGQHPGLSCTFCCKTPDDPFARPTYCLGPADSHYDNFTGLVSPVGSWKPWEGWSACSVTCGTGSRERTRSCDTSRGLPCRGASRETEVCHVAVPCPHWGPYHEIGACSVTCGQGAVEVERTCSTGNNNDCAGSQYGEKPCDPVYAVVVLLAVTTGFETANRHRRFIVNRSPQACCLCDDTRNEGPACATVNCRSTEHLCSEHMYCMAEILVTQSGRVLTKRSCGTVEQCVRGYGDTRSRPECFLPNKAQHPSLSCTLCCKRPDGPFASPTYCMGSPESTYTNLSSLSNTFTSTMSTPRTTPATVYHTTPLSTRKSSPTTKSTATTTLATTSTSSPVTTQQSMTVVPVDNWKPWENWGACSVTCGTGSRERTRICDTSRAMACRGAFKETEHCNTMACPYWGSYHETGPCSVTCGQGFVEVKRECSTGHNKDCAGSSYDEKPCNLRDCPKCEVCSNTMCQAKREVTCPQHESYCMNTVSVKHGKVMVLKKECVSYAECYFDAHIQQHGVPGCGVNTTSLATSSSNTLCRYCCRTGDSAATPCNIDAVPSTSLHFP